MMPPHFTPSDRHLRRRYVALLQGEPVIDDKNDVVDSNYERWRELKRMVIVYGLPHDEGRQDPYHPQEDLCSLRGRIWKVFLSVPNEIINPSEYQHLVQQGPSPYDGDIRNDTFRTFRGDATFAKRVPEDKLVRLLNAFFNDVKSSHRPESLRYVQGMNVLCAPLLFALPETDAYYTFRHLILRHCPKYMAPQLKGVENGCILVDRCLEIIDPELYQHLSSRGITARIYALPLILSLFACVPPLQELLRVWDVLFAVGVHFVVLLAVAHTVLLRDEILHKNMDFMKVLSSRFAPPLQSEQLISVAMQLLHRLPEELIFEIARHPLEQPDDIASLPYTKDIMQSLHAHVDKPHAYDRKHEVAMNWPSLVSPTNTSQLHQTASVAVVPPAAPVVGSKADKKVTKQNYPSSGNAPVHVERPPWK